MFGKSLTLPSKADALPGRAQRMSVPAAHFVPAMAAQLNLGIWLPEWAGPAPWETATVSFASVRVWQYDDPGDVRGVLVEDIADNFDEQGLPQR